MEKCSGCLTKRAINILNNHFRLENPYSRSSFDWEKYIKRIKKLKIRNEREENRASEICYNKEVL